MAIRKRDTNFEINLLPVISLLAVCISFLLLTTVWIHLGTLNINQAMGEDTEQSDEPSPALWVSLEGNGVLAMDLKHSPKAEKSLVQVKISGGVDNEVDVEALRAYAQEVRRQQPDLKLAMILPNSESSYDEIIVVMDEFKKQEFEQLGIAPL